MGSLLRRLWYLLRERRAQADLTEELSFHREMTARELEGEGLDVATAHRVARRALGNTTLAHDQVRDVWVPHWLQGLSQDFRLGLRMLASTPSVTAAAILSLALGIGANTAIFSLIDSLLLRQLPVRDAGRLVMVTDGHRDWDYWFYPVWQQLQPRHNLFDGALAWAETRFDLANGGQSEFVNGIWISGSYFDVLGVPPLLGRTISERDDAPGGGPDGPAAVISYDFWQRHFGGALNVLGRGLTLDRVSFTIVGVAPRGFVGTDVGRAFDVAVPFGDRALTSRANGGLAPGLTVSMMARLHPDQTIDAATVALRGIQPEIRSATMPPGWPPAFRSRYLAAPMALEPGATGMSSLRDRFSRPLLAMLSVVALVLLVACANLANLSLARATARRRELGMRLALGASVWRLMRQQVAEGMLLATAGAAAGLAVSSWFAGVVIGQLSTKVSVTGPITGGVFLDTSLDGRVLAFAVVLTMVTLLVVATVPAWRAARIDPLDAIAEHRRSPHSPAWRATDIFIVVQVSISLVLIASATLLVRTLRTLEARPLGFDRQGLLVATIDTRHASLSPDATQALYVQIVDAVRRLPDTDSAALSFAPAVVTGPMPDQPIEAVSGAPPLPRTGLDVSANLISPGWFKTMKIPIVAGRDVGPGDRLGSPQVVIVNQAFARKVLGATNPLGHTITLFLPGAPPPSLEIVGVAADSVYGRLRDEIRPAIFLPIAQRSGVWLPFLSSVDLTIRSRSADVGGHEAGVARTVESLNGNLSLALHPLTDYIGDSLVQERLLALLSGGFALLALVLSAVGLYGVTVYAIARRRSEIAIRMALGASTSNIVRLAVWRLGTLIVLGSAAGVIVSLWTSTYFASLLYSVQPRDPVGLGGAVVVLALTAMFAAWTPVRRAIRTDPASSMRCN